MARHTILAAALLALAAAPAARAGSAPPAAKAGDTVTVKREGVRLMKAARFYGAACPDTVTSGTKVKLVERQKGWARIAAPGGGKCWLHESAWSDRTAGELASAGAAGSQRDVELAGRGFSEDEEKKYRGEQPDLAPIFQAVDAHVAAGEPGPDEMNRFAAEGGLGGGK
jgi:hypothetical protein